MSSKRARDDVVDLTEDDENLSPGIIDLAGIISTLDGW